ERGVDRSWSEMPRLDRRHPRVLGEAGDVADDVRPRFPAVTRDLQVAVIGPRPDYLAVPRRLRDRVNRRVHLGRGVVDGDAARLLLLLLQRIVGRQIGRDTIPGLSKIARPE